MLALAMGRCGAESKTLVPTVGVERDMGSEPLAPLGLKRK